MTTSATSGKRPREAPPVDNPDANACCYYVARKQRFCRTQRREGSRFCPTHDTSGVASSSPSDRLEERVPCPINPNHSVFVSRLAKHVKVCPDLRHRTNDLPYFIEDLHANRGLHFASNAEEAQITSHKEMKDDELQQLIQRILACYDGYVVPEMMSAPPTASPHASCLPVVEECANSVAAAHTCASSEEESMKHGPQHRALIACVDYAVSCCESSVDGFVELGAGKGGLSVAMQKLLLQHQTSSLEERQSMVHEHPLLSAVGSSPSLMVVDYDGFRRKGDARVSHSGLPLTRLRINLKDLDLAAALQGSRNSTSTTSSPSWVALGKHLCGACTDFGLSCLAEATQGGGEEANGSISIPAVVLATCCHHRCEARHLNPPEEGGKLKLPGSSLSLTTSEFAAVASMTSWAVSGAVVNTERQCIGRCCKRIIDAFRVAFLRRLGYTAFMWTYATREVTEENVCLVAYLPPPTAKTTVK